MSAASLSSGLAILAANGFDENHITEMLRALTKAKIPYKIIAPEQGLVNGWQDTGWGHYFTVDAPIGTALGSDYDALVLVGGERGVAKLKTNLHTRRIVNHFLEAGKPVAAIGAGAGLLALSSNVAGRRVAAPADMRADLAAAGASVEEEEPMVADGLLLTADGAQISAWVEAALELFRSAPALEEAA